MGFLNAFNSGKSITEGTQGAIPYTLPPTNLFISLLPAPQQDNKRTIWRGLKCRNKKNKKKEENIEQER